MNAARPQEEPSLSVRSPVGPHIERVAWFMRVVGVGMIVFLPVAYFGWPAGFQWKPDPLSPYAFMLGAMYVALGIVLLRSASDPARHTSIIDYTIYSSVLHATLMLGQSIALEHELTHLIGDVPLLYAIALVMWLWHPRRSRPAGSRQSIAG